MSPIPLAHTLPAAPAPEQRGRAVLRARRARALALAAALGTSVLAMGVAPIATTASAAPAAHVARAQKLSLRHTSIGTVLVDSSGFTVYRFSKDTGKKNTCITTSECSVTWPALTTTGQPSAGPGVKASLLGTITLAGGVRQVTYAGHPLYRYAAASERGETGYAGVMQFGGTWYAVSASGANVR